MPEIGNARNHWHLLPTSLHMWRSGCFLTSMWITGVAHAHKKHSRLQRQVNRGNFNPRSGHVFVTHMSCEERRCMPLWGLLVELHLKGIMNCFNPNSTENKWIEKFWGFVWWGLVEGRHCRFCSCVWFLFSPAITHIRDRQIQTCKWLWQVELGLRLQFHCSLTMSC